MYCIPTTHSKFNIVHGRILHLYVMGTSVRVVAVFYTKPFMTQFIL